MTSGADRRDRGTSLGGAETSPPGPRIAGARRRRNGPDQGRPASGQAPRGEGDAHPERDTPVPHDFGRDGTSGLVDHDRALRAREVSRPTPEDEAAAVAGAEAMLRRLGRHR